jgi:glycosyltransferase involved in cell wall biosynthesis
MSVMSDVPLKVALLADAGHVNCRQWCEGLMQAGADVHVLSFGGGDCSGSRVYGIPPLPFAGKLKYIYSAGFVGSLLRKIRPDVVVAYYVTGYGTLARLARCRPLVQVTSGSDILRAPRNPLMRTLLRINLRDADLVTAWAPHMAETARELGVVDGRLFVLPRGIPLRSFSGIRSSHPHEDDAPSAITTRSLKPGYNADVLIESIHLLKSRGTVANLTIAGDGLQREELMEQAERLQLGGAVRFAGFVNNDKLALLLARHNLYISVPDSDGVSASLLEAMALGLLPIVPDEPSSRYWIANGVNGLLLERPSPEAVAEAVQRAMSDLSLRERAWRMNPEIVASRADLYRNSKIFVEKFKELVVRRGTWNGDANIYRA